MAPRIPLNQTLASGNTPRPGVAGLPGALGLPGTEGAPGADATFPNSRLRPHWLIILVLVLLQLLLFVYAIHCMYQHPGTPPASADKQATTDEFYPFIM